MIILLQISLQSKLIYILLATIKIQFENLVNYHDACYLYLSDMENMDVLLGNPNLAEDRLDFDLLSERSFRQTREQTLKKTRLEQRLKMQMI